MFARDLVRVARAPLALAAAAAATAIAGTAAPAQADERKVITSSTNKELIMEQAIAVWGGRSPNQGGGWVGTTLHHEK